MVLLGGLEMETAHGSPCFRSHYPHGRIGSAIIRLWEYGERYGFEARLSGNAAPEFLIRRAFSVALESEAFCCRRKKKKKVDEKVYVSLEQEAEEG